MKQWKQTLQISKIVIHCQTTALHPSSQLFEQFALTNPQKQARFLQLKQLAKKPTGAIGHCRVGGERVLKGPESTEQTM